MKIKNQTLSIPCENCGKKFKIKLSDLKKENEIRCPNCNFLHVSKENVKKQIENALQKEIRKIQKKKY